MNMVASKGCLSAKVFSTGLAKFAGLAGALKPGNAHTVAFLQESDVRTYLIDDPHRFMSWNNGTSRWWQFTFDDM
jgi:hypothetical protein